MEATMASLAFHHGRYRVDFRYAGKRYVYSLKTPDRQEAEGCLSRLEENLRLLERGRLEPPPNVHLPLFLLSDGRVTGKPEAAPPALTLDELCKKYVEVHSCGSMEATSLSTVEMHLRQLRDTLGDGFAIARLKQVQLQAHVTRRAQDKGIRGRKLSPVTLRKEVGSFRAVWNWAVRAGLLSVPFPNAGLVYPKTDEKPPFQTWAEIERQIARGGLSEAEQLDLWDCLFLTVPEVKEVLEYIRQQSLQPFVYPMIAFAAHTGARRSEIVRCRIADLDLESSTAIIREKKRNRSQRTLRRVPISPFLAGVLRDWLQKHPGGPETFCQQLHVPRSRTLREGFGPLTRNEAVDHFERAVQGSKWERLRGWHVFRHSFASNCAAKGVDQRLIDAWMGHQTEEMRKRYRHLIPAQQREAILAVFG
jgi:integrase